MSKIIEGPIKKGGINIIINPSKIPERCGQENALQIFSDKICIELQQKIINEICLTFKIPKSLMGKLMKVK